MIILGIPMGINLSCCFIAKGEIIAGNSYEKNN